jgi:hypothetical protein
MTTLPPSLVRFEDELSDAIARDLRPRFPRLRPRQVARLSIVAAASAAVALGVLSALPGAGGPGVVARAAAALRSTGVSVLHVEMTGRDVRSDGSSSTWREESWQQSSAPYAFRDVRIENGVTVDTVTDANDHSQLYDASTNTVYSVDAQGLRQVKEAQPEPAAPAKKPVVTAKPSGKPGVKGEQTVSRDDPMRAKVLGILESGGVAPAGHVTVDGRDAVKLASTDGFTTILVDPQTYQPIVWSLAGPGGVGTTVHFTTYERMPAAQAGANLFDLVAQHPGARVDTSAADYAAALARLGGKR